MNNNENNNIKYYFLLLVECRMCIYIYICMYVYIHIYIYIYMRRHLYQPNISRKSPTSSPRNVLTAVPQLAIQLLAMNVIRPAIQFLAMNVIRPHHHHHQKVAYVCFVLGNFANMHTYIHAPPILAQQSKDIAHFHPEKCTHNCPAASHPDTNHERHLAPIQFLAMNAMRPHRHHH